MGSRNFPENAILQTLKQVEGMEQANEVCRELGTSEAHHFSSKDKVNRQPAENGRSESDAAPSGCWLGKEN